MRKERGWKKSEKGEKTGKGLLSNHTLSTDRGNIIPRVSIDNKLPASKENFSSTFRSFSFTSMCIILLRFVRSSFDTYFFGNIADEFFSLNKSPFFFPRDCILIFLYIFFLHVPPFEIHCNASAISSKNIVNILIVDKTDKFPIWISFHRLFRGCVPWLSYFNKIMVLPNIRRIWPTKF